MMSELHDVVAKLYAPFPLDMHSIREGHRLSNGKRIQWFVYLDRAAIQRRLDELFPLDWSFHHVETHRTEHYATATVAMTVHGCTRVFNGGQEPREKDGTVDQDTEKGAFTEAFRRVASLFGLGLYAYEGVRIVTDSYERGDWDRQRDLQAQAWKQFEGWYHKQFGSAQQRPATPPPPAPEPQPEPPPAQPRSAYAPRQQDVQTGVTAEGETAIVVSAAPKGNGANRHLILKTTDGQIIRAWTRQPFRDGGYEESEMWSKEGNVYKIDPPARIRYVTKEKGGNQWREMIATIRAEKTAVGEHVPSDLAGVEL